MTSDLEHDLQLALRAGVEHVTPERLRHDGPTRQMPAVARRGRWAVAGPILAAACVAVLALAITLVATHRDTGNTQTTTGRQRPLPPLVGTSWTLGSVRHGSTTTSVPQTLHAGVQFLRRGVLGADDGVNSYTGSYTSRGADTILVRGGSQTQVGYAGHDPGTLAAIKGIDAILSSSGGGTARHAVTGQRRAGTLTLAANGYTLTFTAAGHVRGPSAPASATAT